MAFSQRKPGYAVPLTLYYALFKFFFGKIYNI